MIPSQIEETLQRIRTVTGGGDLPLHEPDLDKADEAAVSAAVRSGFVSSVGSEVVQFEKALSEYCQVDHVVATSSGTTALQIALLAANIQPLDEVLVPAMTFSATANAVIHCGAFPHFVDIDEISLGIDSERLQEYLSKITQRSNGETVNTLTGRRISAMVVVHTLGHIANMQELNRVASEFGIVLIEDAAAALGSRSRTEPAPGTSNPAILSFNGNKVITTGGGGAVLTNSERIAAIARHLSSTARIPHAWEIAHDAVGYNYRMPNLNAALGISQMNKIDKLIEEKRTLAGAYKAAFNGCQFGSIFEPPADRDSNYWLNCLLMDSNFASDIDSLFGVANDAGLQLRKMWTPLNLLKPFSSFPSDSTPVSESIFHSAICLPSSAALGRASHSSFNVTYQEVSG